MGNIGETQMPLFDMIRDLSETGAKTARTMYGCRGWVAHHNTDLWRIAGPVDGASWGMFPKGGAWLATHIWQHYLLLATEISSGRVVSRAERCSRFPSRLHAASTQVWMDNYLFHRCRPSMVQMGKRTPVTRRLHDGQPDCVRRSEQYPREAASVPGKRMPTYRIN